METVSVSAERVPTNMRALLILEWVAGSGSPATSSMIADSLRLPRQTVHRVCATLVQEGFLKREGTRSQQKLVAGPRLHTLAAGLALHDANAIARRQILQALCKTIGETVNYVVAEPDGMRYLDRVEADWPLRMQLPVGSNVPFHCTASGKTYLASLPPSLRAHMIKALSLDQQTPKTIVSSAALLAELDEIRRSGFALDREEFMSGMVASAVPVHDSDGRYVAALACHGPTVRFTEENALAAVAPLREAARSLGAIASKI